MARQNDKASDKLKQKSLMAFFGKQPAKASSNVQSSGEKSKNQQPVENDAFSSRIRDPSTAAPSSDPAIPEVHTPLRKGSSQSSGAVSPTYTKSSEQASSVRQTPPTSDPVDVDMLSDDDDDQSVKSLSKSVSALYITHISSLWRNKHGIYPCIEIGLWRMTSS